MSAHEAPDRDHDQRLTALVRANHVRAFRSEIKRQIRTGEIDVGQLLLEWPPELARMRASTLLQAVPGIGPMRVRQLFFQIRIAPSRTLAGLSQRQRTALRKALRK